MEYIVIEVPDMNDSVCRIVLNGTQYQIRFTWHDISGYWYFSVQDALNNPILTGVKIVPMFPLNVFYYSVAAMPSGVFGVFTEQPRIERKDFTEGRAQFVFIPSL